MGHYFLQDTPDGSKTLVFRDGKEVRLHSAYNPEKEAERAAAAFSKGRASMIVVSGLGLGYHCRALTLRFPDALIVALEHDNEVVSIARNALPDNLNGIIVITDYRDLSSIFEEIDIAEFRGIAHFPHRPSYLLYKNFYDAMLGDIQRYISSKVSDLLTRFEFEEQWAGNIIKNTHHLFTSHTVKGLFGRFRAYPGIICSAGPSLRKNIDLLGSMRERALIICVDTAIKVLQKKNITPHIIMTIDAQKHSVKHFLGLKYDGHRLLADMVSNPGISRRYSGEMIFSTTSKYFTDSSNKSRRETTPLMDWLEPLTGEIGDIQSGGSVATSAFDLLLNMGCNPIILVGQDLAYTGREIHCSGTYHNDDWLPMTNRMLNLDTINQRVVRKRKIKYIESFGGDGNVISDFVFDLYRGWFEDSAAKVAVTVINATEGGARIKNTREETLDSLKSRLKLPARSPDDILNEALAGEKKADPALTLQGIDRALQAISAIHDLIQSQDKPTANEFEVIMDRIDQAGLHELYNPYLRKTRTLLARHAGDPEKASRMTLNDIMTASTKLTRLLSECKKKIELLT